MSLFLAAFAMLGVAPKMSPLKVDGNQVVTDQGKPVLLRGVNVACMEWSSDGEGHLLETVRVAVEDWKSNIIRLPLSQDRWFGKGPEQTDGGKSYRGLVKQAVDWCGSHGCYILLDLHWNDAGVWGQNIGQHQMPDMNSVEFWKDCAKTYRNRPEVLFDLYNEPHNISWEVWRNGGTVVEKSGPGARQGKFVPISYTTPGMQPLLETVRKTGAKNVIVAGGLDWAYDLSGFLNGSALTDTKGGRGVIYACHAYPFKGDTIDQFLTKLDAALPKIPVLVSEFGAENKRDEGDGPNPWITRTLAEMETRKVAWTAWDLHPAAGPRLLAGWDYKPTPSFGVPVKEALAGRG